MSVLSEAGARSLVREILARHCERFGVSFENVGDDDDLYASGIIDSYGLVDLLSELESRTGAVIEFQAITAEDGAGNVENGLSISIRLLGRALTNGGAGVG